MNRMKLSVFKSHVQRLATLGELAGYHNRDGDTEAMRQKRDEVRQIEQFLISWAESKAEL